MIAQQLHYTATQERIADLHRAAQHARRAQAATERRYSRDGKPITRLRVRFTRLTARLAPSWP